MDCCQDLRLLIEQYRRDPEYRLNRILEELNGIVENARTSTRPFRPLTAPALMHRVLRIQESLEPGNNFQLYFETQNFLTQWITNNGVEWELAKKQNTSQALCLFITDWLAGRLR